VFRRNIFTLFLWYCKQSVDESHSDTILTCHRVCCPTYVPRCWQAKCSWERAPIWTWWGTTLPRGLRATDTQAELSGVWRSESASEVRNIWKKICDKAKPYLSVHGKRNQHTKSVIIHCTYGVGETGSSWQSFMFSIFLLFVYEWQRKELWYWLHV
jgi:hypothetical protein